MNFGTLRQIGRKACGGLLAVLAAMTMSAGADAQDKDLIPIRIASATASSHAPIFYAAENGIFEKHGLDAKIVMFQTGVEMINTLMAGDVDVTTMGSVPFIASASKGLPVMLISHYHGDATTKNYAPYSIVSAPHLNLKEGDLEGLRGKTIGMPRGAASEPYAIAVMRQAGLEPDKDYKIVNLKPGSMLAALKQESVDAVAVWEPWASAAVLQAGGTRLARSGCETCFDPGTHLTTKAKLADADRREALKRFVAAEAEATQWVRAHKDGAEPAENASHWITGVDKDVLQLAIKATDYDPRISKNTFDGYRENLIPLMAKDGRADPKLDPAAIIDDSLQKEVMQESPELFDDLPPLPQ